MTIGTASSADNVGDGQPAEHRDLFLRPTGQLGGRQGCPVEDAAGYGEVLVELELDPAPVEGAGQLLEGRPERRLVALSRIGTCRFDRGVEQVGSGGAFLDAAELTAHPLQVGGRFLTSFGDSGVLTECTIGPGDLVTDRLGTLPEPLDPRRRTGGEAFQDLEVDQPRLTAGALTEFGDGVLQCGSGGVEAGAGGVHRLLQVFIADLERAWVSALSRRSRHSVSRSRSASRLASRKTAPALTMLSRSSTQPVGLLVRSRPPDEPWRVHGVSVSITVTVRDSVGTWSPGPECTRPGSSCSSTVESGSAARTDSRAASMDAAVSTTSVSSCWAFASSSVTDSPRWPCRFQPQLSHRFHGDPTALRQRLGVLDGTHPEVRQCPGQGGLRTGDIIVDVLQVQRRESR